MLLEVFFGELLEKMIRLIILVVAITACTVWIMVNSYTRDRSIFDAKSTEFKPGKKKPRELEVSEGIKDSWISFAVFVTLKTLVIIASRKSLSLSHFRLLGIEIQDFTIKSTLACLIIPGL